MDEQKKYQPLVERILEKIESENEAPSPGELCAKYNLEVPRVQTPPQQDKSLASRLPSREGDPSYPNLSDLADLANPPSSPHSRLNMTGTTNTPEAPSISDDPTPHSTSDIDSTPPSLKATETPAPDLPPASDSADTPPAIEPANTPFAPPAADLPPASDSAATPPSFEPANTPFSPPATDLAPASDVPLPVTSGSSSVDKSPSGVGHPHSAPTPASPAEAPGDQPSTQFFDQPVTTNLFEKEAVPERRPERAIAEKPEEFSEVANIPDEIPALFHRTEVANSSHGKPTRNVLFGLTGATLLGAASIFLMPEEPQVTNTPMTPPAKTQLFSTSDDEKLSVFSGGSSIISGKDFIRQIDTENAGIAETKRISIDLPEVAETPAPAAPAPKNAGSFASINGPLDALVQNVVKDLAPAATNNTPAKNTPPSTQGEPVPGAEATLNQLENSLENIVSQSTGTTTSPEQRIVVAQAQPEAVAPAKSDKMKALTDDVVNALSGLSDNSGNGGAPLDQSVDKLRSSLSALVQEAESRGKSAGSVEQLLKEALGDNQKNLPAALKNADGTLDITTLIASVVKRADPGTEGGVDADYLSALENEGKRTALASRLIKSGSGKRYLVVRPGDTLSSIAYATYGDSFLYPKIFRANKAVISNPNTLRIGTRLVIPE